MLHHATYVAFTGVTPWRHDCKMASRGASQQHQQEETLDDWKLAQFPTNVPSRKIPVVKKVSIPR